MTHVVAVAQGELLERTEVGLYRVEPRGIVRGLSNLHAVAFHEAGDVLLLVHGKVVHDKEYSHVRRVARLQPPEGEQDVLCRLALPHHALKTVGMHVVESEQLLEVP